MKTPGDKVPRLSVLVMAYKRKEFTMEALQSALDQTIPRSDYEIACVVGFLDDQISAFLDRNNIKEIFCDGRMGQTITTGIAACSSDIVVFLEDDDKFRRDKLERVMHAFKMYNCIYYHNNTELIDERSKLRVLPLACLHWYTILGKLSRNHPFVRPPIMCLSRELVSCSLILDLSSLVSLRFSVIIVSTVAKPRFTQNSFPER